MIRNNLDAGSIPATSTTRKAVRDLSHSNVVVALQQRIPKQEDKLFTHMYPDLFIFIYPDLFTLIDLNCLFCVTASNIRRVTSWE